MAVILSYPDFCKAAGVTAKNFTPPKLRFVVNCSDEVAKAVGKDPLWQQKVVNAAQKEVDGYKANLVKIAHEADKQIDECVQLAESSSDEDVVKKAKKDAEEWVEQVNKGFEGLVKLYENDIVSTVEDAWTSLVKLKSDYKKYKIKAGAVLALTGAELAVSIVSSAAAASGTFGVGAVLGLVGIAQKIVSIGAQVYSLAIEAETVLDSLDSSISTLAGVYSSNSALVAGGREITANILNDFFDAGLMDSIKTATDDAKLAENKVKGVVVNSHKLSTALQKLLKEVDKVSAQVKKDVTDPAKKKKGLALLDGFDTEINNKINAIIAQAERASTASDRLAKLVPLLNAVQAKDSKAVKIVSKVASLGISFGMSIAGADSALEGLVDFAKDVVGGFVKQKIAE